MKKSIFILLLTSALYAGAADMGNDQPLRLKDGSYLFISEDNTMRMVDKDGRPIQMKDGVEMELEDGTLIMMKNEKIWRHDHRKHKGLK
ncbi:MAG TPA: CopK family periplasmic copper-binding protein [Gammaproteobacteria bacterium]